jgi:hypothetical protein
VASLKRSEIERTERQSASLKRELRLPDLVLLQVLLIMAAVDRLCRKARRSHVVLWVAGNRAVLLPLAEQ